MPVAPRAPFCQGRSYRPIGGGFHGPPALLGALELRSTPAPMGSGCTARGTRSRTMMLKHYAHRVPKKRSEEHTSELQSQSNLVCRLLLEKKKKKHQYASL